MLCSCTTTAYNSTSCPRYSFFWGRFTVQSVLQPVYANYIMYNTPAGVRRRTCYHVWTMTPAENTCTATSSPLISACCIISNSSSPTPPISCPDVCNIDGNLKHATVSRISSHPEITRPVYMIPAYNTTVKLISIAWFFMVILQLCRLETRNAKERLGCE